MTKKMFKFVPMIMLCALLVSCATAPPQATYNPLHDAATGTLVPKVDNFLVVLDAAAGTTPIVRDMAMIADFE